MAMVTITLRDGGADDEVDIVLQSEPPLNAADLDACTSAQVTALIMLNAASDSGDATVTEVS